ncbi:hypothetical protein [Mycolicibacterium hippocampi]|uniref:hypothetical protein n=1 Tax=Mycolicibacterium hippocampi TaxID=659824 RepID=UPI003514C251
MTTRRLRLSLLIGLAALVLGVASTFALAAVGPGTRSAGPGAPIGPYPYTPQSCEIPALSGTVVSVTLTDMHGSMMGPRTMHGQSMRGTGPGGPYDQGATTWPGMRMMSIVIEPTTVPAGEVSFRVLNAGAWIHELTVLPLGQDKSIGQRRIEPNNQVDESAGLGHVEASCGADEGDGLVPGAVGWTTITLEPGRYELICNIAGHYWAGMYTELTVTG